MLITQKKITCNIDINVDLKYLLQHSGRKDFNYLNKNPELGCFELANGLRGEVFNYNDNNTDCDPGFDNQIAHRLAYESATITAHTTNIWAYNRCVEIAGHGEGKDERLLKLLELHDLQGINEIISTAAIVHVHNCLEELAIDINNAAESYHMREYFKLEVARTKKLVSELSEKHPKPRNLSEDLTLA